MENHGRRPEIQAARGAARSADPALQHHHGLRHAVRRRPHRPSDHRVCALVAAADRGRRSATDRALADPDWRRGVAASGGDCAPGSSRQGLADASKPSPSWRAAMPPATSPARPPATATTSWARWRARSTGRSTSWAGESTTSRTTAVICARSWRAWSKEWSCSIRRAGWSWPTTRRAACSSSTTRQPGGGTRSGCGSPNCLRRSCRRSRRSARRRGVRARARPVANLRVPRRAGRRARGRRDPGAARHQRPAARRPGPARLRRQRLARTPHAAHRHSRLRRGAARRPARRHRRAGGSSRSSRATRPAWSAW